MATPRKKPEDKLQVGRPTKYEPRFCAMVEKDMAEGFSLTAFAGSIGVNRQTIDNWMKEFPEFFEACMRAKAGRLRFWEKTAISVASKGTGGPGAATVITFGLKNMGDGEWSDTTKTEHTGKDGTPLETKVIVDPVALAAAVRTARDEF